MFNYDIINNYISYINKKKLIYIIILMYNINNIIKYIVQALAIYLLLNALPLLTNDKSLHITTQNIIIITTLLMLIFIIFENLSRNRAYWNINNGFGNI